MKKSKRDDDEYEQQQKSKQQHRITTHTPISLLVGFDREETVVAVVVIIIMIVVVACLLASCGCRYRYRRLADLNVRKSIYKNLYAIRQYEWATYTHTHTVWGTHVQKMYSHGSCIIAANGIMEYIYSVHFLITKINSPVVVRSDCVDMFYPMLS